MRTGRATTTLLLSCAIAAASAAEPLVPPRFAKLLDAAHDAVLKSGFVPSPEQKVGEVRLIRRGDADVVQTLLYTKILARGQWNAITQWKPRLPRPDRTAGDARRVSTRCSMYRGR